MMAATAFKTPQPGHGNPSKDLIKQMCGTWIRTGAKANAARVDSRYAK
jgi:hypothetical protein